MKKSTHTMLMWVGGAALAYFAWREVKGPFSGLGAEETFPNLYNKYPGSPKIGFNPMWLYGGLAAAGGLYLFTRRRA